MFSKKALLNLCAVFVMLLALAAPSRANFLGPTIGGFTGTLTDVSNTFVNVVDFDNRKVVRAFVPTEQAVKFNLVQQFRPGEKVKIRAFYDKRSGRWILAAIKRVK
jgi:hypothetical protein